MLSKTLHKNTGRCSGCTLTGALSVTTGVNDAVTIIHGPDGCAHHNLSLFLSNRNSPGSSLIPLIISSGLQEKDIIFGGEGALKEAILRACSYHPGVIFVVSTCLAGITGDDVEGICSRDVGVKVIPIRTEGFLGGGFQEGVVSALMQISEGTGSCSQQLKSGVNIIGEKNLESSVEFQFDEVRMIC